MAALYHSLSDLEPIEKLILTAARALDSTVETPERRALPRALGVVLGAAVGLGAGAGILAAFGERRGDTGSLLEALTDLGAVFGGDVELGIAIAGSAAIVGGAIGNWLMAYFDNRRLIEAETILLQEAWRLHEALLAELNDRREKEKPGGDDAFLFSLATKLKTAAVNLKADLKRKGY